MATLAKVVGNEKRRALSNRLFEQRLKLKKLLLSPTASAEEKEKAFRKLNAMPRNASRVRVRNRCGITGRPRGFLRKFKMSRIALRDYGLRGDIPGLIKSSW